jgi:hypothetical protein
MFRLPLSDLEVTVRPPTGQEDILLLEAHKAGPRLGVALLRRLVTPVKGECDCGTLPVMDYEALLLALHVAVFGNEIQAELSCPVKACGCRVDISFGIEEYLAHYSPCHPKGVEALPDRPGWFELGDEAVRYRLPRVEDVMAVTGRVEPERELLRRCLDGRLPEARVRRKLERIMEMQAPSFSHELQGWCPGCQTALPFFFDVEQFVLEELRGQAAFVYRDTHLLALHYHWPESQILDMPSIRRIQYAELLRGTA